MCIIVDTFGLCFELCMYWLCTNYKCCTIEYSRKLLAHLHSRTLFLCRFGPNLTKQLTIDEFRCCQISISLTVLFSKASVGAKWGSTEPSARLHLCSWRVFIVHNTINNNMITARNSIPSHTISAYFFKGLQWFTRTWENASFTSWHSNKCSTLGYTFSRPWIELV